MTATGAAPAGAVPLSPQQEQIWFLHRIAPAGLAHHARTTVRIVGEVDLDRLDRVVTEIARRHELLRTTYTEVDGRPQGSVHPPTPVRARRIDLRDVPDQRERLDEIVARELHEPFRTTDLPLVRWTVVRLADAEHELVEVAHHLVHDASCSLLLRELAALYNASSAGTGSPLPDPPPQYRDRHRTAADTPAARARLDRRREQLADLPPPLELPVDRPRPVVRSYRGDVLRVDLPPGLPAALRAFGAAHEVTVFDTMLAAFAALLHRWTGQRDLCLGTATTVARHPDTGRPGGLVGPVVETVLLRCDVDPEAGLDDLVRRTRDVVRDATADGVVPFAELVRALNPEREPGRNPLTEILFSLDDDPVGDLDLAGATATVRERRTGAPKVDLDVVVVPGACDDGIALRWEYSVDLFDPATVRRTAEGYLRLLADAVARPTAPVHALALLDPRDRAVLLDDWNAERDRPADDGPLVHHAVRARARATPHAVAVREVTHEVTHEVTYAELVERADALGAVLRARGVRPHTVVGVCLPRGVDLVVAQLATLCVGAAYLPLDPENPPARLAGQYAAAGAVLVLTHRALGARLPGDLALLAMDAPPDRAAGTVALDPEARTSHGDLAYLIATSGSTGQPKIVMIEHGSLCNVVAWRIRRCALGATDRIAQVASPGFDTSVMDIWPTLVCGATLCVPDRETRLDPERLRSWLVDEAITVTELPTALAERLLELTWPTAPALRELITGGDRLRVRPAADLPFRVLNEYGPTEATATATAGTVEPAAPGTGRPDIGRPITGTAAYVLDPWRRLVPPGVTGELWIGGVGVARGYHGAPRTTAERFVPDPFSPVAGARMYRTGDLVRHLPDGRIDFLGRRDRQIKLRGYRIEPAEIVEVLRAHPEVTDAVVLATAPEDGEKRLVAYLEARDRPDLRRDVLAHLADHLPRYMVPAELQVLDALPHNSNGKVDEQALPPPGRAAPTPVRAPGTPTERLVADAWCAVLRLERVGVDDDFFDVGGHSLLLTALRRELASRGHDLTIVAFFEHPTIEQLARLLDRGDAAPETVDAAPARRRGAGRARLERRREALRPAPPAGIGHLTAEGS